jgi:hypothetical protein
MPGQIEERIGLGDAHALRTVADFHDLVPGRDVAGFQHTEVEPGPVMLHQQRNHARPVHPDFNPVAGHARLRHFEQRAANPITVGNGNVLFTTELARRLDGTGVTANCFHPGLVSTGFNHNNGLLMNLGMTILCPVIPQQVSQRERCNPNETTLTSAWPMADTPQRRRSD